MPTNLQSERDAFNAFLDSRMGKIRSGFSLEDAIVEFRAYQQELADAQAKVQEAKASTARGESQELDIDELVQEVTEELIADGILEQS